MPPVTAKGQADGTTTASFVIPQTGLDVESVYVTIDASGAAGAVTAELTVQDQSGAVIAKKPQLETVDAGLTGSATWALRLTDDAAAAIPITLTYYQVIAALSSTNTLVGQWHLTEGVAPFADTSGSMVGGNAELLLQSLDGTYTPNNADGPLNTAPAGPSVKFNVGSTNPPTNSDYLHTSLAPLGRFTFAGNAVFTAVAWVKPVSSANIHFGGVVGDVVAANFGTPAEIDDGWCIVVKPSTLECQVQRYCAVPVGGSPDSVSLGAMSTAAWTMVAMTYDGATLRGYADGTLIGTAASAGVIGGAQDVLVGLTQGGDTGLSSWYRGAISEVSVWAATLSASDIALLYLSATV